MNGHERGGFDGCLRRRGSSLRRVGGTARSTLGVVIILVLAMVAGHACYGTSPTTAATLGIGRAFGRTGSCHQGRES